MSTTATVMLSWPPRLFAMSARARATAAGDAPAGSPSRSCAELVGTGGVVPQPVGAQHETAGTFRSHVDHTGRPLGRVRSHPVRDRVQERALGGLLGGQEALGHLLLGERVVDGELAGSTRVEPVGAAVADPADHDLGAVAEPRTRACTRVDAPGPRRPLNLKHRGVRRLDRLEDGLGRVERRIRGRPGQHRRRRRARHLARRRCRRWPRRCRRTPRRRPAPVEHLEMDGVLVAAVHRGPWSLTAARARDRARSARSIGRRARRRAGCRIARRIGPRHAARRPQEGQVSGSASFMSTSWAELGWHDRRAGCARRCSPPSAPARGRSARRRGAGRVPAAGTRAGWLARRR